METKNKLTYTQLMYIIKLEEAYPEVDWQGIAVLKGYDHMISVYNYWRDNIQEFLNR